ncbi:MAG: polysaccharide biosynthesis protein [Planctomycetaceae bacterium]
MTTGHVLEGKRILVTGGTGSLGKTMVRRLLTGEMGTPEKVIVLSRDEAKQHDMRVSYLQKKVTTDDVIYRNFQNVLEFRTGDIRRYPDVAGAMRGVNVVINAAALKQVPNCEYFPEQAILTNCDGPSNIVRAIRENEYPVETVVGVSTDKACKPINVMGMTKSLHERIFIAANIFCPRTRFICTRYGNVLASRGSVIPLFHDQIKQGGPVTVTVPKMTRFLMSLDEAVDCVFEAIRTAKAGETIVPRAPSSTIHNLATALIGKRDIKIEVTGIRPGEKMHEIMISDEESHQSVRRGDYFAIRPMLPELQSAAEESETVGLTKEFSSADTVMTLEETVALLEKNNLLVGQADIAPGVELFEAAA